MSLQIHSQKWSLQYNVTSGDFKQHPFPSARSGDAGRLYLNLPGKSFLHSVSERKLSFLCTQRIPFLCMVFRGLFPLRDGFLGRPEISFAYLGETSSWWNFVPKQKKSLFAPVLTVINSQTFWIKLGSILISPCLVHITHTMRAYLFDFPVIQVKDKFYMKGDHVQRFWNHKVWRRVPNSSFGPSLEK